MKKNFNRILSLILCLVMCFSFSTVVSAASVGLSVSLDSTEAEEGNLPSTVSMSVGTTSALSIMSFGAEAYASDSRITISEIQKEDTDLVSNTSTGRFAFMAMSETSVTDWATVVFSIPADLPAGTYTLGVRSVTASRSDNSNPIDGITEKSVTFTVTAAPANSYTVTVNGSYASTTGAGSYEAGETVYIYAGDRNGYSFDGWTSSDVTINNANSKDAYFTMPADSVVVTANWTYNGGGGIVVPTTYTLTFDTNGGTAIASVTKPVGSVVDLSGYVTTKTGYEFSGWYADKALTEKVTSVKLTKNMTVYAKWTEIPVDDEPCDGGANCPTNYFTDVDQSQWYHEGIDFVVENDMMKGVGDNKFDPHGVTSRAMIVTILYRLEGEPTVTGTNPFSDVKNDTWYTDAVIWAEANGIVNGYGDGKFGPDDDITREQMAKIMYNYAEYKGYDVSARASLDSFSDDGKISSWATEEMQWAVAVGLIKGMGDETVAPQGDAERCQVATIFMRFCEKFAN